MHTTPVDQVEIVYPDSDGQPMAENTLQFEWIVTIKENLEDLFRQRDDVFVAGDLLWYPVEGNNTLRMAPDALVSFGRPKGYRGSYMQWREGQVAPQVVWEVLSPGNRAGELENKFHFYERYGVEEYYQYDPDRGELRGWLRQGEELQPIEPIQGWRSPRTGVRLEMSGGELVLTRPDGRRFLSFQELAEKTRASEARAEAAEARVEQERRDRKAAEARVEQERRDREAAETREERLKAKLRALGQDPDA